MSSTNLAQNSMEGKNMLRQAFKSFLDSIIIENHKDKIDYWSLYACDLPHEDKKIFLSYLITVEDFEDFTSTESLQRVAFKDYEGEMQYLINERIDDLYHEIQYEQSRS